MEYVKKFLLSYLCAVILAILLYITFHELGHILVAMACGAAITNFSIMTAHMSYIGGNFSQATVSLLNASGMILPVLICLLFILIYNRSIKNMFYHCFFIAYVSITIFSIAAWIIVPVLYMFSAPPAGDDVAKFLITSQLNPFIVIFCAILLITIQVVLAYYKGVFTTYIELSKKARNAVK